MENPVPEAPGSGIERSEPRFGERPISPRFTLVLAVEAVGRPVVLSNAADNGCDGTDIPVFGSVLFSTERRREGM